MPDALLDSTTFIDLERALKRRRETWSSNSIANILAYRQQKGNPYLSVVKVVAALKGLHRDLDPAKVQRFKQMVPPDFHFLDMTTDLGYLAGEISEG